MSKLLSFILVLVASICNAQNSKPFVTLGAFVPVVASTEFKAPFSMGTNLFVSNALITSKSFHSISYGFGNNSLLFMSGYFLKHNFDVYGVYSKSLSHNGNYAGLGIERMEKVGNVKFFEFCELGTTFNGSTILSVGLITNVSWALRR